MSIAIVMYVDDISQPQGGALQHAVRRANGEDSKSVSIIIGDETLITGPVSEIKTTRLRGVR